MVDVTHDPRWGRVMEGAGEDPYLGSRVAEARVRGFQGDDLSAKTTPWQPVPNTLPPTALPKVAATTTRWI
jgi:beta-glucosidase-like glycosyl hydrolase